MAMRRIAYVIDVFPKLSETFIAGEIAEVCRRGIGVRILSIHEPQEQLRHDFIAEAGLDRLTVYGAQKFSGVLRDFSPDSIHAHYSTTPAAKARALAAELGVPFTFTAHGFDIYSSLTPPDFADRAAAAAAVITVSEANAQHIAATWGVPRERVHVIPCGVDTLLFRPEKIGSCATLNDVHGASTPALIVCIARQLPVKNLGLLLEACAVLRARGVSFRCVMIGDGPDHDELVATRARLGLETVVEMIGAAQRTTILQWLRRASIVVLSSASEGMPVSLMEAGACAVPAVATRVGGIPELVEDGVTGLLTPPNDAPAMADAIGRLIANPRLRAEMGRAARRRIDANFSLRRQVDRLLALWSRVETVAAGGGPICGMPR
jgi:glycosyltransferase involved in cell wall biosynthesis